VSILIPPEGGWQAVTFDLWNTLLVSVPGAVEVRLAAWRRVVDERGLELPADLLRSVLELFPARFEDEWRAGRQYGTPQALNDAFRAFAGRIGPAQYERPLGVLGQRRPRLLARDQPPVAFQTGPGRHVGQVRSCVRFRVPLAPVLGSGDDRRDEPLLEFRRPEGDQGGSQQRQADVRDASGGPGLHVGLVEDNLFGKRGVPTTQVLGVVEAQPASVGQLALPGQQAFRLHVLLADASPPAQVRVRAHEVLLQPGPHLVGEGLLGSGPGELHGLRR